MSFSSQTGNQILHPGVDVTGRKIQSGGISPVANTSLSKRLILGWNFPPWATVARPRGSSPTQLERTSHSASEGALSLAPVTGVVGSGPCSEAITPGLLQQVDSLGVLSNRGATECVGGRILTLEPESPQNPAELVTYTDTERSLGEFLLQHIDPTGEDVTGCKKPPEAALEDVILQTKLTNILSTWATVDEGAKGSVDC